MYLANFECNLRDRTMAEVAGFATQVALRDLFVSTMHDGRSHIHHCVFY